MRRSKAFHAVLALACGWFVLSGTAFGQIRENNGNALDANTRLGSGGSNKAVSGAGTHNATADEIANGNVTNGFAFRGAQVHGVSVDGIAGSRAFRGLLPGMGVDQFTANSVGVPTMSQPVVTPASAGPQAFYGTANNPGPPPGALYTLIPSGTGYISSPPAQPQMDTRVISPDVGINDEVTPESQSTLVVPSMDDQSGNGEFGPLYSASPLYGVRSMDAYPYVSPWSPSIVPGMIDTYHLDSLTPQQVLEMRRELNQDIVPNPSGINTSPEVLPSQPNSPGGANELNPNEPLAPLTPPDTQIQNNPISPQPGQFGNFVNAPALPAPALQSSQYAKMQQELSQMEAGSPAAQAQTNEQLTAALEAQRQSIGGAGTSAASPAGSNAAPAPVKIESLATGMNSPGLAEILTHAEQLLRQKQYDRAIDSYNNALSVAPNNALLLIGRANAELGGGYYHQAEVDLRAAFKKDHATLLGQYDLMNLLGDSTVQALTAELKRIANDSPNNASPLFLLSYIAYNTGHPDLASAWLKLAMQRGGGSDDVIPLMQRYWQLSSSSPATQPNAAK